MATTITALLSKKGWTGDEVGKAIIFSLIDAYRQTLNGIAKPTELFSPTQLKRMVSSLTDREQSKRYNRYVGLNNWVSQNNAIALSYYEQARGEMNRLFGILTTAAAIESEYRYIEQLPEIMTQKQYDETKDDLFESNNKARLNGVAIIRSSDLEKHPDAIDEQGYYTAPQRNIDISLICGLEQFTPLNKHFTACVESVENARKTIENGYYSLLAYDTAVELIAEYIDVPDFSIFKIGKEPIAARIHELNHSVAALYAQIENTDYRDTSAKEIKLQILRDHFPPIQVTALCIPTEAIKQAKALLNDNMKAFEVQDNLFLSILSARKEEEGTHG